MYETNKLHIMYLKCFAFAWHFNHFYMAWIFTGVKIHSFIFLCSVVIGLLMNCSVGFNYHILARECDFI